MKQYIDLVKDVLENGEWSDNRTGMRTKKLFTKVIEHDLQKGFPLLTTKKMAVKSSFTEMLGFIRGITDINWYKNNGCNIWNANHNDWHTKQLEQDIEKNVNLDGVKFRQENPDSLGLIYGYQWRNFNGFDQLEHVYNELKNKSNSRRLVISGWNPTQFHLMCLPPCHVMYIFNVMGNKLNLAMTMRSSDLGLGVPYNLANTALFLHIMAHTTGYELGKMSWIGIDVHIYENHIEQLKEQVLREPKDLPKLTINCDTNLKPWEVEYKDIVLENYFHYSPIKMEMVV